MTTKQKGNIGMGVAMGYFLQKLYTVSIPLNDSQGYDLVVDFDDDGLKKIQVKSTSTRNKAGNPTVDLRTTGGNRSRLTATLFDKTKCDYIFIYLLEDKISYLIPSVEGNSNSITLVKKYDKYKI